MIKLISFLQNTHAIIEFANEQDVSVFLDDNASFPNFYRQYSFSSRFIAMNNSGQ
jgi:hypothetical protein